MSESLADPFPIRFPSRTAARLTTVAARLGISKTAAVREAVDEWLNRHNTDGPADTRTGQEN